MYKQDVPWKQVIEFHKEIAIRSEESFFTFALDDKGSDRYSFLNNLGVHHMSIDSAKNVADFSNQSIISQTDKVYNEFYLGGIFWFVNRKIGDEWIKYVHPLLYKPYYIENENEKGEVKLRPKQARWDITPLFFKLIEKKGISIEEDLSEIVNNIMERSAKTDNGKSTEENFVSLFIEKFPELKREFVEKADRDFNKNWVLFVAPKDYSAIQRNLIIDYSKLLSVLERDGSKLGGFSLFESGARNELHHKDVTPYIPLNDSQHRVVEKVISGNEITVVSGPPGCGKSQVVVSMLLNAWEDSKTVLFASSNNQAVNVVRERIQQFENDIPMVVRCGARNSSELMGTIKKLLTVLDSFKEDLGEYRKVDISSLKEELMNINELMNTSIPQRIDELIKSAFSAYSKSGDNRDSWEVEVALYRDRIREIGIECSPYSLEEELYMPYFDWIDKKRDMLLAVENHKREKSRIERRISGLKNEVRNLLSFAYENINGERFVTRKELDRIKEWYDEYKNFILGILDTDIYVPIDEISSIEWETSSEISKWCECANNVKKHYREITDKYLLEINALSNAYERMTNAEDRLYNNGIEGIDITKEEKIREWISAYNEFSTMPKSIIDTLPFARKAKLEKKLLELENSFIEIFGSKFLMDSAADQQKRRKYISERTGIVLEGIDAKRTVLSLYGDECVLQREQKKLNEMLHEAGFDVISKLYDAEECEKKIKEIDRKIDESLKAKYILEKKEKNRELIQQDWALRYKGNQLLFLLTEKLTTEGDIAKLFDAVVRNINEALSPDYIRNVREIIFSHSVEQYLSAIDNACRIWDEIDLSCNEISEIHDEKYYQEKWKNSVPKAFEQIFLSLTYDETLEKINNIGEELSIIYRDWNGEGRDLIKKLKDREQQERARALDNIGTAIELCPSELLNMSKEEIYRYLGEWNWNYSEIKSIFNKISADELTTRKAKIQMKMENAVVEDAISKRISELSTDDNVKAALERLYFEYQRTNEVISKQGEDDFGTVLKALPIWITTGQSPQAIPMKAGLFDLLIIDEATQCTITSILPLVYRCKRVVVIGDINQLPEIDSISSNTERLIAEKFKVENVLYLLGHCGHNIYETVLKLVPMKKGNVITLNEHYRSHPLIIGFSNYYVYRNRLFLKKAMKSISENNVMGIFGVNIQGSSMRSRETDSWINDAEANRVVELLKKMKEVPEYSNSDIGIISPFRGQVEYIKELIEGKDYSNNVFVSTVHKYQGDEKDIIIFSPVVSRGISSNAAKWVETPQNLINVAVTRARDAFFLVGDFDICRTQPGILGKLVQYIEKIELLRKTSLYELQLFGLMVLQGWKIDVHPRVGDIEVDFIVSDQGCRIVVEVDGRQHEQQTVRDRNRDAFLAGYGYDVIRITTRDIEDIPFESIERIRERLI